MTGLKQGILLIMSILAKLFNPFIKENRKESFLKLHLMFEKYLGIR